MSFVRYTDPPSNYIIDENGRLLPNDPNMIYHPDIKRTFKRRRQIRRRVIRSGQIGLLQRLQR